MFLPHKEPVLRTWSPGLRSSHKGSAFHKLFSAKEDHQGMPSFQKLPKAWDLTGPAPLHLQGLQPCLEDLGRQYKFTEESDFF